MLNADVVNAALAEIMANDRQLGEELEAELRRPILEAARPQGLGTHGPQFTRETIVMRTGRPVLTVRNNEVVFGTVDAASEVWRQRLTNARARIKEPLMSVGRIDLEGHPDSTWVGTGWLVRPDVIVTNAHVAQEFARRDGEGFTFRIGLGREAISASIDFLREADNDRRLAFSIDEVLHIEADDGPDLALMRVSGVLRARPIALSSEPAEELTQIAVIGYPARDSRIPDQRLMEDLFGNVYDCKRVAPGQIKQVEETMLLHDCSTLGGNSGSVLLDLQTGKAVGIHFAGHFLEANYAVPASLIEARLQSLR